MAKLFAIMKRSYCGPISLWADMAGGLAMLDFITQANEFGYSEVQYAIKFAETRNSLFIPSNRQVIMLTYLHTG